MEKPDDVFDIHTTIKTYESVSRLIIKRIVKSGYPAGRVELRSLNKIIQARRKRLIRQRSLWLISRGFEP